MKIVINLLLSVAIVFLGYLIYKSIEKPVTFQSEKDKRFSAVIQNLKDIRTAQMAYKAVKGEYTASFDSLTNFIKTDSFPVVRAIGTVSDDLIDSLGSIKAAEELSLKKGWIIRDSIRVSVKDSIFNPKKRPDFDLDKIMYIPYANGKKFNMGAGEVMTGSKVKVKVFEAKAPNHVILNGMDKQLIINLNEECENLNRYKGLKVGSLEEASNNAGNWE